MGATLAEVQPRCSHCEAVKDTALCGGLSPDEFRCFTGVRGQVMAPAGTTIFREGDAADHLFSVTVGLVKLYKLLPDGRRQITAFLLPGDVFGLAVEGAHMASAETVVQTILCRLPMQRVDGLYEDLPRIEKRIYDLALRRLAVAQDQMLTLGRKTAKEKIATFLVTFADRAERRGLPASPVNLPMSRTDIADYLGLTIETVSRSFTQMKREGLISLNAVGSVALLQPEKLRRLAEGA